MGDGLQTGLIQLIPRIATGGEQIVVVHVHTVDRDKDQEQAKGTHHELGWIGTRCARVYVLRLRSLRSVC